MQGRFVSLTTPPLFSVIVLARDIERYIGQCLGRVFEVQDPAMEVIVVEVGFSDGTNDILASLKDPRLTAVRIPDSGPAAARNAGLARSRGRYIVFFDANDFPVVENWSFVLATLAANPDAVLAYGAQRAFGSGDDIPSSLPLNMDCPADDSVVPLIFLRNLIPPGTAFIKRDALVAAGGWNERLHFAEDWDLCCRLACLGRFISCPVLMTGYRKHDETAIATPASDASWDAVLAAIDAIYSSAMVKQKLGNDHAKFRKKALTRQAYHWGTRSVRNGVVVPGARAILWSIAHDPALLVYLCAYPKRWVRGILDSAAA
jgi:glycosyltransferase involved in cell wall biosynthesis